MSGTKIKKKKNTTSTDYANVSRRNVFSNVTTDVWNGQLVFFVPSPSGRVPAHFRGGFSVGVSSLCPWCQTICLHTTPTMHMLKALAAHFQRFCHPVITSSPCEVQNLLTWIHLSYEVCGSSRPEWWQRGEASHGWRVFSAEDSSFNLKEETVKVFFKGFYFSKGSRAHGGWCGTLNAACYLRISEVSVSNACWWELASSSVPPPACEEVLLQGHLLINDWGWISVSISAPSPPPSCRPPNLGAHREGGPYLPHIHTEPRSHAHTYPELSRDRLTVTQRCPVTSDLPESCERANCWLTTEIQLKGGGAKGEQAEREKFSWKFATLWLCMKHVPMALPELTILLLLTAGGKYVKLRLRAE